MFEKLGTRFRRAVESFARDQRIPWVQFGKDDRKVEVMRPHLERQAPTGRSGVAAIAVAQEFQYVFTRTQKLTAHPPRRRSPVRSSARWREYHTVTGHSRGTPAKPKTQENCTM